MFSNRHYVPILKWKQGEQKALELLTPGIKEGLTPLIEVPPIDWDFNNDAPKRSIDEHLVNVGDTVSRSWKQDRPLYLDLCYIEGIERMANGVHPLTYSLEELRNAGVKAIPVTGSDRDAAYQAEVIIANQIDNLGLCIRLKESDFNNAQTSIDSLLVVLGVQPQDVDLVIDYEYVDPITRDRTMMFLRGMINNIPYLHGWRNVILIGTAVPKDLSQVGRDSIDSIERSEWLIWKTLIQNQLDRIPIFGDYVIASPEPFEADPRVIKMSANIRYTGDDKFIIFKGRELRKFGYGQYYKLAAQVTSHAEYQG